jgi:hypothetical protein
MRATIKEPKQMEPKEVVRALCGGKGKEVRKCEKLEFFGK